ncbi:uncharacterized protein LAESUDRAFT_729083 [Laetiporus sulphureus 93-53]|uniref:Uncharacterized protein n=1 Tax=Laetiporus sulphureus 93-53 TaxID=1314785 RepID=A0A165CVJ3_9APHY|nr:uncharacterized protein LAESUDRAFT_729083 [Laetiporus sulphureus 93-53]KZT03506.1 hypothetical protein LAESUDRAFT_729083 [Laetiporus sulphureus 93-53]
MPAGLYRLRDNHPNYPQDHVAWISTYSELSGALSSETHRSHPHPQPSLRMDHSHDAPTTLDQAAAQDGIQDFRHAGNWTSRPIDVAPEYMSDANYMSHGVFTTFGHDSSTQAGRQPQSSSSISPPVPMQQPVPLTPYRLKQCPRGCDSLISVWFQSLDGTLGIPLSMVPLKGTCSALANGLQPICNGDVPEKASIRMQWPGYSVSYHRQMNIRNARRNPTPITVSKLAILVASHTRLMIDQYANYDCSDVTWQFAPRGPIHYSNIILVGAVQVSHRSIQPIFEYLRK